MNLFVCIKQVPDTETKIKIKSDKSNIDSTGVKWIISPYDEMALEEAIRTKEKNPGSTVTVLSAGPARVAEGLRKALAMGADQAIQVDLPENVDAFLTAKALAEGIKKIGTPHVIFTGKEAIDDGANQVSQMIAGFLNIPSVGIVLQVQITDSTAVCKREVEGGTCEVVEVSLPMVLTVQKGINEPRYPNVQNMMQARKKEIKVMTLETLQLSLKDQKVQWTEFELPPPKPPGKKIIGDPQTQAKELIRILHEELKVV